MNAGSRPGRTDDDPTVRRTAFLSTVLEEVVPEVYRDVVVLEELLSLGVLRNQARCNFRVSMLNELCIISYISVTAVKDVEGTVVFRTFDIIDVVFHLEFDGVAFIVFSTFESLITIFLRQPLKKLR